MPFMIIDTETTSLNKPFCYDLGIIIYDDNFNPIKRAHYVIEQNWHNLPLFETAYYKEKRPKYVALMRSHKAIMKKYGYIMRDIVRDIQEYNIEAVYAYNAPFDDNTIAFNCEWFKCNNPFEAIPVYDIRGYANQFITNTQDYKAFCDKNNFYTDTGNYSATAENVYRYITNNIDFDEAHTGLEDAEIEGQILKYCVAHGAALNTEYEVTKILSRPVTKPYTIKVNGKVIHTGEYTKLYQRDNKWYFTEPTNEE